MSHNTGLADGLRNGYKVFSFQTYKAICLIPLVYRVSQYLLVNLGCHEAIELVMPCVGGQNTSLKHDFLTALREP